MNKIIYHATTAYHILEFIIHKCIYGNDSECTLLVPEFLYENLDEERLLGYKYFDEILVVRYRKVDTSKGMPAQIDCVFEEFEKKLIEADQIHVAGAQYWISDWLIRKHIKFYFWEEASGTITKGEGLHRDVLKLNEIMYELAEKNGMFEGKNEFVVKRYCNLGAQEENFDGMDCIDFVPNKELMQLTEQQIDTLLNFYRVPQIDINTENNVILLTNHYANLGIQTVDEQSAMYMHICDYYLRDKEIFIKLHPNDFLYYALLVPNAKVIKEIFPAELLPYAIRKGECNIIATVASTGIRNIKQYFNETLEFNNEYLESYKCDHLYFWSLRMVNEIIKHSSSQKVFVCGVNYVQIKNISRYAVGVYNEELIDLNNYTTENLIKGDCENIIIVGEKITLDELSKLKECCSERSTIIFLHKEKRCVFYETFTKNELLKNIIYKKISFYKKKGTRVLEDISEQGIFVYSKNKEIREEVLKMDQEYELINSEIKTRISESTDKDQQIAVLTGILEATEKRLLFYIENSK